MKKNIFKGIIPILTAFLILNQAVFLFSANVDAQTIDTNLNSLNTTSSTTIAPTTTNTTVGTTAPTTSTTTTYPSTNTQTIDTTSSGATDTNTSTPTTSTTPNTTTTSSSTNYNTQTTASSTAIIIENEPSTTQSFYISFVENFQSPFSGDQSITVYTNQEADNVYVSLSGAQQAKLTGFKIDSLHYRFIWNTKNFPNGSYKVLAAAAKGTEGYVSKSFTTEVKNTIDIIKPTTTLDNNTMLSQTPTSTTQTNIITDTKTIIPMVEMAAPITKEESAIIYQPTTTTLNTPTKTDVIEIKTILDNNPIDPIQTIEKITAENEQGPDSIIEKTQIEQTTNLQVIKQIIATKEMPIECRATGINSFVECETLMREKYIPMECISQGIATKEECQKIMMEKYGRPEKCKELNEEGCQKLEREIILSNFIEKNTLAKANEEIKNIVGRNIRIQNENNSQMEITISQPTGGQITEALKLDTVKDILPLAKTNKDIGLMVLGTKEKTNEQAPTISAVLFLDNDGDGLTDDMEKRLGTNPNVADSDNDGFSDGEEVKNNYNPLGEGGSTKELSPIEKAIVKKTEIEQPKNSGEENNEFLKIKKVVGIKIADKNTKQAETLKIEGQANADEMVSLFIYSAMPIVVTVKADANGNWIYELDKTLIDGKHEAYVVVNDEDGKIKSKSAPFSFFIKEAKAVDQDNYLQTEIASVDVIDTMIYWYMAFGALLIAFGISFYFLYNKKIT